ncbi:hypothetical protein JD81_00901 [Micromonospora sagamiensis]|uniref:Uncharacterized protein n=1 Tax=Micromonospora sagamiensis TaxID=47875 RepID=A0A562WAZ7_9ACTN|nr:hypothetical protein JD81_00901 [Micromonospora sagamiensis]
MVGVPAGQGRTPDSRAGRQKLAPRGRHRGHVDQGMRDHVRTLAPALLLFLPFSPCGRFTTDDGSEYDWHPLEKRWVQGMDPFTLPDY